MPEQRLFITGVTSVLDQSYEYGVTPPEGIAVIVPLHAPLHNSFVAIKLTFNAGG